MFQVMQEPVPRETLPPLVTPELLAANSKGAVSPDDPRLEFVAAGASTAIRNYCRWHVTPVIKETVTVDVPGRIVKLPTMNLLDVEDVVLNGEPLGEDDYAWSSVGLLMFEEAVTPRFRALVLTMTHGFHQAPDLIQLASKISLFSLASPLGVTREQAGQVSISWGTQRGMAFSDQDETMLRPYRLQIMP